MLRAESLPAGTRVVHGGTTIKKIDFNLWLTPHENRDEWFCDRQVNILLDTGATIMTDAADADPSLTG
jgi:hypothetical protein